MTTTVYDINADNDIIVNTYNVRLIVNDRVGRVVTFDTFDVLTCGDIVTHTGIDHQTRAFVITSRVRNNVVARFVGYADANA